MKSTTFLIVFLAASLSLGMTGISFARGGGMGGGMGGGIGGGMGGGMGGGIGGSGFVSQGYSHSPRQEMSGPTRGQSQQGQYRNEEEFRHQNRNEGKSGAPVTDGSQGGNNGNHYGQQNGGNDGQGEIHRATPATPATPAGN